jgi:hypothetical protein
MELLDLLHITVWKWSESRKLVGVDGTSLRAAVEVKTEEAEPANRSRADAKTPYPLFCRQLSSRTFHAPLHVLIEYVCSVGKSILSLVQTCDSLCVSYYTCFEMGKDHPVTGGIRRSRCGLKIE